MLGAAVRQVIQLIYNIAFMIGNLRFFLNIFKFYSIFLLGWATGRRLGANIGGMGLLC